MEFELLMNAADENWGQEKIDYSEAAYDDSQHEYLKQHKSEGIKLEDLQRRRASQR
jgi:hypothetical protein